MRHALLHEIANLEEQKSALEEEVRQLRAAIQLYTVVARRVAAGAEYAAARETARRPRLAAVA